MIARVRDRRTPRCRRRRIAGKKRSERRKLKRVVGREFPDARKAADVDGNVQRNHVTIRPLNREDSVLYFPPEAFGPFRVLHQIGAGTLGPVFRAYETDRDRLVAIKVFRRRSHAGAISGARRTVRGAHRSAISVIRTSLRRSPRASTGAPPSSLRSMRSAIRSTWCCATAGRSRFEEAVPLIESLASAIDHAAARGVHHGSLHLRDIILSADASRRLTGFGIRRSARSNVGEAAEQTAVRTAGWTLRCLLAGCDCVRDGNRQARISRQPERVRGRRTVTSCAPHSRARWQRSHPPSRRKDPTLRRASPPHLSHPPSRTPSRSLRRASPSHRYAPTAPDLICVSNTRSISWRRQAYRRECSRPIDDLAGSRSGRWPIVAVFLVVGALAALAVGFFLKSPTPVAIREPKLGVDETTVELPANSSPVPAPARQNTSAGAYAITSRIRRSRAQAEARARKFVDSIVAGGRRRDGEWRRAGKNSA